ncbi:ABC transporter permease subunit [Mesorhizobium sp.]|uniref:ABC transporter permease n=1 Tax=Mesorhizobium sp. TaxID=1871066 RepID=UPI000FE59F6E|nr:ABC transporter permease subunit [Mesorhizobium sp.]RWI66009.1 MAG: ABC transporter permease subunit [Mesorhizobium sp.]TIN20363.1 MAG: ABC transporter permease subunit [Mesorhizobium sp.]
MSESIDPLDPFASIDIPIGEWINSGMTWVASNFREIFQSMKVPIQLLLDAGEQALLGSPPTILLILVGLIAWQTGGVGVAASVLVPLIVIGLLGIWIEAMTTLSIVLSSVIVCVTLGIPLGILMSRSDRVQAGIRPVLDLMQTIPSFVYLVPIVMLFGIGKVPGAVVTIIYALPPVIRLTNFGIREVRQDLVEAIRAFGANDWQVLWKVQLPQARPAIMTGVNQTIMHALGMVVVASMISVPGLGQLVLRGIGRLDLGLATVGGVGIVMLAISIDRLSQSFAQTTRQRVSGAGLGSRPLAMLSSRFRVTMQARNSNHQGG